MEVVTAFLQAAINLVAAMLLIIVPVVIAKISMWFSKEWALFKAGLPENVRSAIETAVTLGADLAEKLGADRAIKEWGMNKKALAMKIAQDYLVMHGYEDVDLHVLEAALESLLFNNPDKYPSSKS